MKTLILIIFFSYIHLYAYNIDSIPKSFSYHSEIKPITEEKDIEIKIMPYLKMTH